MDNKIGVLWKKTNEKGEFYTGVLDNEDGTKTKIVVFKNGYKDKETQPDYMILKSKEKQEDFKVDNDNDLPF